MEPRFGRLRTISYYPICVDTSLPAPSKNINTLYFKLYLMGQIITKVKITVDKAGAFDDHYNKLTVGFDGTKQDLLDTVANFLTNQKEQGLISDKDLRGARIEDDTQDKDGIFGNFIANVKDILTF